LDLLVALALAIPAGLFPAQDMPELPGPNAWRETWKELDALARSATGSAEHRRIAADLEAFQARRERAARKRHDRAEAFRSRVLAGHLARTAGAPFRPVADPGVPIAWLPGEAWLAAQVAAPGPTRADALEAAIADAAPAELAARLRLGCSFVADDARELHLDWAEAMARAVHAGARSPAAGALPAEARFGPRTAGLVALVARLRGDPGAAISVLEAELSGSREARDRRTLLVELARARLGAGTDAAARRDLGEALTLGSSDAAGLLGRFALSEGAVERARALFRSLLEAPARPASALRGHGLSLLTDAAPSLPAGRNHPETPR
jgi:hypothetical protein